MPLYMEVCYGESFPSLFLLFFFCLLIGLSNFNSKQVDDIISKAQIKPAVLQVECHPYLNQAQLIKHCKERDIVGGYIVKIRLKVSKTTYLMKIITYAILCLHDIGLLVLNSDGIQSSGIT